MPEHDYVKEERVLFFATRHIALSPICTTSLAAVPIKNALSRTLKSPVGIVKQRKNSLPKKTKENKGPNSR
jgi:hypothetical protein